jgi:hypothetical protein
MMTSELAEAVAAACYERGADPLDVSEAIAGVILSETLSIADTDPLAVLAVRRILGGLLDCGWQPPPHPGASQ